jgi:signal transduction histidine kinase
VGLASTRSIGQPLFTAYVRDLTERKRVEAALQVSEERFRQAQKMEAIGRLAGGVAHDFNNLLVVILSYSDLLLRDAAPGSEAHEGLTEIHRAGERAAALTQQLLAFSRKQVLQPRLLDPNHLVAGMEKLLKRLIGEDIDLVTVLDSGVGRVKADPGQLEQVLLNLAVNARDAMPDGGKLTVETANVEIDQATARLQGGVQAGRYVLVAVSDTGVGMDDGTRARIFEPFFTTKEQGKGTGLGLAMVYGIVQQSGGHLTVYSEPGHGTTFKIYLPLVDAPAAAEAPAAEPALPRGRETVLVVEDEASVRGLVGQVLRGKGYTVLEASQGEEALAIVESHPGPIHMMLTDVVMPVMSGRQLADRVAQIRPGMRTLFASGYPDGAITRHGVLTEGTAFLQKPFTPDRLERKVREVLSA